MQNDKFDTMKIPTQLEITVKEGLIEGNRRCRGKRLKKRIVKWTSAAAAIIVVGVILGTNPVLAAKIPFIGNIFSLVQDKIDYKGDFSSYATPLSNGTVEGTSNMDGSQTNHNSTNKNDNNVDNADNAGGYSAYMQTSNGITMSITEVVCSEQALYLSININNEEGFPNDFIRTEYMEGYILNYDYMYMMTMQSFNIPGYEEEELGPYMLQGEFIDNNNFVGVLRAPLIDNAAGGTLIPIPEHFVYNLNVNALVGELLETEEETGRDCDGEEITYQASVQKRYEGTWNFAIDVTYNESLNVTIPVNETNEAGVGIGEVKVTPFEVSATTILPDNVNAYDYVTVICDANGKKLNSQGEYAEVYSTAGSDVSTIYIYVCDYIQYMDELKMDDQKIKDNALFGVQVPVPNK